MSQNYRYTGVKISQYPFAEINTTNHKNKFNHQHYFISYAPANYGISDINKNFKVPIDAIRKDMIGYIGLSNSKAGWRDYINFWEGDWYNYDGGDWYDYSSENKDIIEKTRSYVYEWDYANEFHKLDFIYNKHGLYPKWDKENDIHRVYLLNTAPLPLEAEDTHFSTKKEKNYGFDPNPNSVKFVSKTYVDDRHCGDRKIDIHDYYEKNDSNQYILKDDDKTHLHENNPSHLTIRPYTCFYQYTNLPEIDDDGCYYIDIWDDCILEDFRMIKKSQEEIDQEKENGVKEPEEFKKVYTTFYDKVKHNRLVFYLRIKNHPEFYYQNDINEDNETYKKHCNNLKIKVNGVDNVVLWSYEDEWTEILREHRLKLEEESGDTLNTTKNYIFLKCEAEYIKNVNNEDVFTVTCSSFFGRKKAIKRIVEVPIKDGKSVNLDLSLHENECFITQVPDDEIEVDQNPIYIDQAVINFTNLDKLDDYHVYSWDYFVITPDHEYDDADKYKVRKDYNYLLFRGAPILWADCDAFNISPDFQPNKMYCLEFVKAFDGCLIGRIKYYVSLVKKS